MTTLRFKTLEALPSAEPFTTCPRCGNNSKHLTKQLVGPRVQITSEKCSRGCGYSRIINTEHLHVPKVRRRLI